MADNPAPAPVPAEDPFDLGDTGIQFNKTAPVVTSDKPLPPRAPDGKFTKPEEQPTAKHPDFLVRQALDFGIDESEMAEMSTPNLYKAVNRHLVRERQIAQSFATQRDLEGARVSQPAPAPADPDFDFGVDLSDFDPRLVAALKKAAKAEQEEVKALKAAIQQRDQEQGVRDITNNLELLDAAFAKLANPLLGEGTGASLAQDPSKKAEFQRRVAILNAAGISDVRQVNRLTIMKLLREANELLFGATTPVAADPYAAALTGKPKPRITPQEWDNGGVARPTARNGAPELKGEALAIKNLTERFREQDAQRTDEAELDGIPE